MGISKKCRWCGTFIEAGIRCACFDGKGLTTPPKSALDVQEGGSHYKTFKIQPIEFTHANGLGFMEGNIIKYVARHKSKNGAEDLKKARHYIDLLLELEYGVKGQK